ncbi:hypothetical protein FACS1894151_04170 [Spirochaetia bacterium]|nr:hypothetical protein FACS1894151_04170 [Spirochaetia bacterium]
MQSADDRVLQIEAGDMELFRIAAQARESLSFFIRKMQNPAEGERDFQVKYPFPASADSGFESEYLWLKDIVFFDGTYYGTISAEPYYTNYHKKGERVPFALDDITDWMFVSGGRIIGGLSIKYLIEKIPEMERDARLNGLLERFAQEFQIRR